MGDRSDLGSRLKSEIAVSGPMSVPAFMTRCLHDPKDGYYATRPRLGADGDFITAPLVSQMFGELIGLWSVETWRRLGRPDPFQWVELGPGDATLISDALRAAAIDPQFLQACRLRLVEHSGPLRELQAKRLEGAGVEVDWLDGLADLGSDPVIVLANEFLDCLPAHQLVRTATGWAERRVGLGSEGQLALGLVASPITPPAPFAAAKPGEIWELSLLQADLGRQVGLQIAEFGGAALFIDYGRAEPSPGDTLQALVAHRKVDPLADPGHADLTMWADFPAFRQGVSEGGAMATEVVAQGAFLRRLGIETRAAALARARPDRAETLARQLTRLIDPKEMGDLFKVCAIHLPQLAIPGLAE